MKKRTALITGVSRLNSIGYGIAQALARYGLNLFLHSYVGYDRDQHGTKAEDPLRDIAEDLASFGSELAQVDADFADPEAPVNLFVKAIERYGHIDVLAVNHVYDPETPIAELETDEIDRHLAINVRASLLLIREFLTHHDGRPGGRIILLTSGQHLGPQGDHFAYIASKGALHQLTPSLSDVAATKGITVNTINPGPTLTYDPGDETRQAVLARMPFGRWGLPGDVGNLAAWLVSPEAQWVTGQVINSEGGFKRG